MISSFLHGPRQVVLITCRHKNKDNVMAASWNMPCSFVPELYVVSVGKRRFSHELITKSECFCINFMPSSLKKQIVLCGKVSGRKTDKFTKAGLAKAECSKISCLRLKEAAGWLECKLVKAVDSGDHTLFIGKVLKTGCNLKKIKKKRLCHIALNRFVEA